MKFEGIPNQRGLRIAALADIHGNIHALNAVLEEIEHDQPDMVVVCGDVATGPFPNDTLDRLMKLGERVIFIRGNADRELVTAYDSRLQSHTEEENSAQLISFWSAQQINQRQRNFLGSFEDRVVLGVLGLGKVLFCHGSPRSDEEIITSLTPEDALKRLLAGINEKVVVCAHTHHQFDREMDRFRVINPGSIGMPYEGNPGAYWALLGPGVNLRKTGYDYERVVEDALSIGYPDASYQEKILTPPNPEKVAAFFEEVAAGRGERN